MNLPTRTLWSRRTRSVAATASFVLVAGLVSATSTGTAHADSDPANPSDPATPTTVTADALPTVQIGGNGQGDGVVWSQAIAGDRVYAGGNFSTARPAGSSPGSGSEVTRNNLLAYDLDTGDLISSFSPNVNGQIDAVAVSPDETRLYIGGSFSTVNGQSHDAIAAFDAESGALLSSFDYEIGGNIGAIVATDSTVYVGGNLWRVGNQNRDRLAAFNASDGALLDWAPVAADGGVRALTIKPDGSKVVVGGSFTTLNGSDNPGYGLGMVDAVTGENEPFAINEEVRNGTVDGAITTLDADEDFVYGGGYTYGKSGGTFEGAFAADWDGGDVHWINDCHGDSYSLHPQGDVIYQAGHFHYCENIDGFRQGDGGVGDYPYNRGTAMSKAATGTATWEPDHWPGGRYYNFEGQPTPSQLTWFPSLNTGQATGQFQGPWNVDGTEDYIVMGGEFTRVNGTNQQGLVRYTLKEDAPNDRGPQLGGPNFPIKVRSDESGQVRINWPSNRDDDNSNLTYRVYRDDQNGAGLVHSRQFSVPYWYQPTMGFTDTGLAPGSSHRYRVRATDPAGNVANSPWVDVTVANSGTVSAYENAVRATEPTHYWRLGEASGTTVGDTAGWDPLTAGAGLTRQVAGAISGDNNTATRFSGTNTGFAASGGTANPPDVFTLEAWFKTNTSAGGKIVGWGNRESSWRTPAKADRHLYMDNTGRIHFGLKPDETRQVVTSGGGLNDGQWHQATATLGESGMKLYIDGEQVDQNADVTVGEHLSRGKWVIGGDTLESWPSRPGSDYFNGDIDEVAQYDHVLTAPQIEAHYAAATGAPVPNLDPNAAFTSSKNGLEAVFDASGSSDSDGLIASYAWDFGDGESGTGANTSHIYDAAGTYDVELTVTDDDGGTDAVTHEVTVDDTPASQTIAEDTFERTTTGGLGSADVGGPWSITGSDGSYSTSGGEGHIATNGAGNGKSAFLGDTASASSDTTLDIAMDKVPADGSVMLSLTGRRIDEANKYNATVRHFANGDATLSIRKDVGNDETILVTTPLPANVTPTDMVRVRLQVDGTSPTQLRAKAWKVGTAEPSGWLLSTTDDAPELQAPGSIGATMYVGGQVSNAPITLDIDNLNAQAVGDEPPANVAPEAAFTSTPTDLAVAFDGSGSSDADGTVESYSWDFGDGESGSGVSPSHTYAAAGTYTVELTVTDDDGETGTVSHQVTVSPANVGPEAAFTSTTSDLVADFDGSGSSDSDGTVESYSWDFGDGESGTGPSLSHTYAEAGTYTVKLTVTDDDGETGEVTHDVTVSAANVGPTAAFTSTPNNLAVDFDGSGSSDSDGTVESYSWKFGDDESGTDTGPNPSYEYAAAGTYTVELTVTDDDGETDVVSHEVTVTEAPNVAPEAAFTSTPNNLAVDFDGSGSSDSDGTVESYSWDFGDGESDTGPTPSHTYDEAGTYPVTLTVTDNDGETGKVTNDVTVSAANEPPEARFTWSKSGLKVDVDGSGSSDPDEDPLSYAWEFGDGGTDTGATASHTYDEAGTNTVTLTVTDDDGATGKVSHDVTVSAPPPPNTAPTAHRMKVFTQVNKPVNRRFRASDTDGDELTIRVGKPKHGWAVNRDGKLRYRPRNGFVGRDRVRYTVRDGNGGKDAAWIVIRVFRAPTHIRRIHIAPARLQPSDRARLLARVRAPRVRERGRYVVRDGRRVLSRGKLNKWGNISTRLKRMPRGAHRIRITYRGSKVARPATTRVWLRVRR